ncbi:MULTISPECIES: hypothetical protein [unclassified Streptomyces]|uniref:hypothetical protein n=1 Tax=unclassified Streptomyces TaxID=2593676 RepID=UPI0022B606C9|nr:MULTISPECIES: hypothetical protein [unclassified Streptomyces]MCZ7416666.1 hypothetical protein [Streptomyces sp. WMMC897]MCZ7433524.1 hypothetical protein [Streptomyces sp. WMMC1477]
MTTGRAGGRRAAVAAAALVLGLVGCSENEDAGAANEGTPSPKATAEERPGTALERRSPNEIMAAGLEAVRQLDSARVRITLGTLESDVLVAGDGSCRGSLSQPTVGSVDVRSVDGQDLYLKGDEGFWRTRYDLPEDRPDRLVDLLTERWIDVSGIEDPGDFCALDVFDEISRESLDSERWLTNGEPLTHVGVEAIPIVSLGSMRSVEALIANDDDAPYLLEVKRISGDHVTHRVAMSDFNGPVEVVAPPDALDPGDVDGLAELLAAGV